MPFTKGHPQLNTGKTHFKKGVRFNPSGEFKKGFTPWSKGTKGLVKGFTGKHTEETKRKISETLKRKRIRPSVIFDGTGKKRTKETVQKIANALRGEKSHLWKGGVTSKHEIIRHSLEYKLWRTAVFERDKYTCIWCGDNKGGNLEADHIKSFSQYPELRFAIDNGRTLCKECHRTTENYGNKRKEVIA